MRGTVLSAGLMLVAVAGCGGGSELVTGTTFSTGTYQATFFRVTPDGQPFIDVLAAGASLTIAIDQNGATTGTLVLPATVPGGPANASMAGSTTITGLTVSFDQNTDTFVRQAAWSRIGTSLQLVSERIGNALYDVTLDRQGLSQTH